MWQGRTRGAASYRLDECTIEVGTWPVQDIYTLKYGRVH